MEKATEGTIENKEIQKSKAIRRRNLFLNFKGMWGKYKGTANFEEPILILMRRNQKAEFYEKATKGTFEYTHSDGEKRDITLDPRYLNTFDYGKETFKGYICHEDFPLPLPEEPTVTAEMTGIAIEKSLNDMKKWKTKELSEKTKLWGTILMWIAGIILAITFYKMLVPQAPIQQIIEVPAKTAGTIIRTISTNGTVQ